MTRQKFIVFVLGLGCSACSRPPRSGDSLLPAVLAGGWQRKSLRDIPPSLPGARRAFEAVYEGPGKLTAGVYDLKSSANALDLVQRWKPAADTVFFSEDNYFATIKWDRADRSALTAFVRALEKSLGTQTR